MTFKKTLLALACFSSVVNAEEHPQLQQEIQQLRAQTKALQTQLNKVQKQLVSNQKKQQRNLRPTLTTKKKNQALSWPLPYYSSYCSCT